MSHLTSLTLLVCFTLSTTTAPAGPATPDQLGNYVGTTKSFHFDTATGKKIKNSAQPCTMSITAADNNTVVFAQQNGFTVTSTSCPFFPNRGSFYYGEPGATTVTSHFKITGKGSNVTIKGKYTSINIYGVSEATYSLKKVN